MVLGGRKSNKERTFEYKQQRARNRNNRVKIGHLVGQQKCLKKRFTAGASYSLIDICTSHYLYTVYHFHEGFVYCHLLPMWNANQSAQCRYSNKYMPYHPRSKSPNMLQSINKNMSNIQKKSNFSTNKQKSSVMFPGSLTT